MAFGRCFENALGAYSAKRIVAQCCFKEWEAYRDSPFEFKKGETWIISASGVNLLQRFAQDGRVRIHNPRKNLQVKFLQRLTGGSELLPISMQSVR